MNHPETAVHHVNISYAHDGEEFEGLLVYSGSTHGRRPGVLVAHAWMGLDSHAKRRCAQLARIGYAAFALDMYGKGRLAKDAAEAAELSGALRSDRRKLRARAEAGLKVLRGQRVVDAKNVAAIGYCFGGGVALELARMGADLCGIVSFHGLLDRGEAPAADAIKAKVLVLHGSDDPLVPPDQVRAFRDEMTEAGADWQFIAYGGAVHAFTNPDAGSDRSTGLAYDPAADTRSWRAMRSFFDEIFA